MYQKIAVIILSYFGFDESIKCIESVQQTLKSDIFLVDNSADSSEKYKIISAFQNEKNIHLYFSDENIGFAAGVNLAIGKALKKGFKLFILLSEI